MGINVQRIALALNLSAFFLFNINNTIHRMDKPTEVIVFYDGLCGLCNKSVRWLIRHDRKRRLRYASIQSDFARKLPEEFRSSKVPGSIIFKNGPRYSTRSDAVIRVMMKLGGIYCLSAMFLVIPRAIRDAVYDWIGRNRYKWFGKYEACPLPGPEEQDLFLNQREDRMSFPERKG